MFSEFRGWRRKKKAVLRAVFWNRASHGFINSLINQLIRINSGPNILRSCFLHWRSDANHIAWINVIWGNTMHSATLGYSRAHKSYTRISKILYALILCSISFPYEWNLFLIVGYLWHKTEKCSEQICLKPVLNVDNLFLARYLNRTSYPWSGGGLNIGSRLNLRSAWSIFTLDQKCHRGRYLQGREGLRSERRREMLRQMLRVQRSTRMMKLTIRF